MAAMFYKIHESIKLKIWYGTMLNMYFKVYAVKLYIQKQALSLNLGYYCRNNHNHGVNPRVGGSGCHIFTPLLFMDYTGFQNTPVCM